MIETARHGFERGDIVHSERNVQKILRKPIEISQTRHDASVAASWKAAERAVTALS
jgi:hypothetical protein